MPQLQSILTKSLDRVALSTEEILVLLHLSDPEAFEALFQTARSLREACFGREVFLYGFVYLSTYCRNDCRFCYYRRSNTQSLRYRKSEEEIVAVSADLAQSGAHLIDLTMGEDPHYLSRGEAGLDELAGVVRKVRLTTGLPVMISPGVVPVEGLRKLAEAGAGWYACYQETHSRELFQKLRIEQDYDRRFRSKVLAHELGMLIEEGLLAGLGEQDRDLLASLEAMRTLNADQVRVMNFIPQQGTPLETVPGTTADRETHLIAIMRLLFPDRLIPASLDVDGLNGLPKRLAAGANVVTSIIPPGRGLAGVAQSRLDIDDSRRTTAGVVPVLEENGLRAGTIRSYRNWLAQRLRME
ncbi:MAG: methylornithine synthase PylB [Desulfohalobiaceae bacterium]|nr:methylornithine synthase PylB [Desulfohalobiaceae bacterium]